MQLVIPKRFEQGQLITLLSQENLTLAELGVSPKYLFGLATRHELTEDHVATLLATRKDYQAGFPKMNSLLMLGVDPDQIHAIYEVREAYCVAIVGKTTMYVSISQLHEFATMFMDKEFTSDDLTVAVEAALEMYGNRPVYGQLCTDRMTLALRFCINSAVTNNASSIEELMEIAERDQQAWLKWIDEVGEWGQSEDTQLVEVAEEPQAESSD